MNNNWRIKYLTTVGVVGNRRTSARRSSISSVSSVSSVGSLDSVSSSSSNYSTKSQDSGFMERRIPISRKGSQEVSWWKDYIRADEVDSLANTEEPEINFEEEEEDEGLFKFDL